MTTAQLYCRLWAVFLSQMHSVSLLFALAQSAQCTHFMLLGKHFYGFRPFWCNVLDQSSWNLFLGVSHSNWHSRVQTCQSGQKLVSPNVITFDVNIDIELQKMKFYGTFVKSNKNGKKNSNLLPWIWLLLKFGLRFVIFRDYSTLIITD